MRVEIITAETIGERALGIPGAPSISHRCGDLFDSRMPLLIHGVNCRGAFGAGVARQIARRFPEVRRAYLDRSAAGAWGLGDIQLVHRDDGGPPACVANLASQYHFGRDGVYVDLPALARSLRLCFLHASHERWGVAMPRIGCGLGGSSWDRVRPLVEDAAAGLRLDLEVWSYGVSA